MAETAEQETLEGEILRRPDRGSHDQEGWTERYLSRDSATSHVLTLWSCLGGTKDQEHGWVARGDLKKPEVLRDVDLAPWKGIELMSSRARSSGSDKMGEFWP